MFSVYGKAGRLFRGSMEELRKIGPTSALSRAQRVAGVGRDAMDSFVAQLAATAGAAPEPVAPDATRREAMAAYAQTASDPGMFAIIYGGAKGAMQPFSAREVSQDEMLKIVAYVRTLEK